MADGEAKTAAEDTTTDELGRTTIVSAEWHLYSTSCCHQCHANERSNASTACGGSASAIRWQWQRPRQPSVQSVGAVVDRGRNAATTTGTQTLRGLRLRAEAGDAAAPRSCQYDWPALLLPLPLAVADSKAEQSLRHGMMRRARTDDGRDTAAGDTHGTAGA